MTDVSFKKLYEEIIKNRSEIKCAIEASETRLLLKIQEDSRKIDQLEKENCKLKEEIETLKKADIKNNIVIFGVTHKPHSISAEFMQQKIKDLLNIELNSYDINNIYTIGKLDDSPIKVELTTHLKKEEILKNCNKLKGTSIYINHDLTKKQREESRELRKFLREAKQDPTKKCYIKNNKLFINNTPYNLEELQQLEYIQEPESNSCPQTPSTIINKEPDAEQTIASPTETTTNTPKTSATGAVKKTQELRNRLRSHK